MSKPIKLDGLGASPGVAKGQAALLSSPEDVDRIPIGSILVARTTRPDLFMAFLKVRGVVTDVGGLTCHAAINAIQLGLPCVVATQNATQLIADGDIVTVNGTTGEVVIEKPS
jgi:pyruvate, water dikinase